jgi:hypothetical protein
MIETFFDWVKEIMTKKRPWSSFSEEEKNVFNTFMINKTLSMNPDFIQIVNYIQFIPYSEKEKIYKIYCEMIPKKFVFSKFVKSSKKSPSNKILNKISQFYECSLGEAEEYYYLLRKEGIVEILNRMGIEEDEYKKLIKEIK